MIRVRKKWTATECTLSVSDVDDSFHADEADFMTAISFNVRSAAGKVLIARRATGRFGLGQRIVRVGGRKVNDRTRLPANKPSAEHFLDEHRFAAFPDITGGTIFR